MVVEIDPTTGAERARTMLSFTPADAELALGSDRSTIYATRRSTADDEQLDVVQVSPDGTETTMVDDVTAFALSPDGRRLAAAYAPIAASDGSTLPARIVERSLTNGAIDRDLSGSVRVWDHPGYERERIDALRTHPTASTWPTVATSRRATCAFPSTARRRRAPERADRDRQLLQRRRLEQRWHADRRQPLLWREVHPAAGARVQASTARC
ncbi:MAG: hypothetical protein R2749_11340 [Acidimicrobiales bacterium]